MKTTLKLALSLLLVTLMISTANAQQMQFGLNAQYEHQNVLTTQVSFQDDLIKDEFRSTYQDNDIRLTYRNGYRGRYYRKEPRRGIDKYYPNRGTDNFVNVYIGLNNYLENEELPSSNSLLSLNPITSYYAAVNFDNITHLLGPIYLDWGAGVSISDLALKTQEHALIKETIKSALLRYLISLVEKVSNASHINVHFVPTISFGPYNSIRVGFGVYAGYRIVANTKLKFDDANGNKQKDKIKDNFYVNPYRYGFRATVGWDSFDLFFNYDVNELFEEDIKAPRLNPVTFGVIL